MGGWQPCACHFDTGDPDVGTFNSRGNGGPFVKQGCGFLAVTVRAKGDGCTFVTIYLQASQSLTSEVNSEILSRLIALVKGLVGVWVVGGDWNTPAPDFLSARIEDHTNSVELDPIVPFKPHEALKCSFM